jgi:hypothetical protein
MNECLWRGKFYHLGKTDPSLDIFDRLNNAYFEIMNKAKSDKIDGDKQQEIMRIANEVK